MYPSLPEEYWQGEPVNFTDYRSNAFKAGLLIYEDALPDFDLRSNSSRKVFVELGFKTTNVHDIDLKYLKGDFDVSGSAFNGGSMDEFITAYIAPGMAYKDVNISYYKIPTHSIDRNNFSERTQWSNYNERTISIGIKQL